MLPDDALAAVPDQLRWTRKTLDLLRRVIQQQETELADLRAQLQAAERRLDAGQN
jgi:septal ring factor EnvC (AmiA/AmiB activator)